MATPTTFDLATLEGGTLAGLLDALELLSPRDAAAIIQALDRRYRLRITPVVLNLPSEAGGGTAAPGEAIQVAGFDSTTPPQLRPLFTDRGGKLATIYPPTTMFSQQNAPAVATQASTVLAASPAGVRHVCIAAMFIASMAAAAMPIQDVTLLDGAAVLATGSLNCPANDTRVLTFPGPFRGTAATSMTAQFAAAPPAGGFQRVYLCGYDISEP